MIIGDIDIDWLMMHVQQIKAEKLKDREKKNKIVRTRQFKYSQ